MKVIKKILFDIAETLCTLHLLILCLVFISQSCNKNEIPVQGTKEIVFHEKRIQDTIHYGHDTVINTNKVTREYHFNEKTINTKITIQPDTIKQYFEKIITEKKEPIPWYMDFWKLITVMFLIILTLFSIIKITGK